MTRAADENGRPMSPLRGLRRILLGALVVGLAACGGGESSFTSGGAVNDAVDAVAVEAGAATLVADDGNSSTRIEATVNDGVGQPVDDASVRFTTGLGRFSNSNVDGDAEARTNEAGIASVTLETGSDVGTARIEAFVGNDLKGETTVAFVAGPPEQLTLRLQSTEVEIGQTVEGTITLEDVNGNPVSDEPVSVAIASDSPVGSLGESGTNLQTDTTGTAVFTYTPGTQVGEDTLEVRVSGLVPETETVRVISPLRAPIELSAEPSQLLADGSTPVTVTVEALGRGNVIVGGVEVRFSADGGRLSPGTVTTNEASGRGTVELTPGNAEAGDTITLTASAQGLTNELEIPVVAVDGQPQRGLELEIADTTLAFNEQTQLRAKVSDPDGSPLPGVTVEFAFTESEAGGTLSATTAETGPNGVATVTYSAGDDSGTDAFRARVSSSTLTDPPAGQEGIPITVAPSVSSIALRVSNPNLPSDGSASVTVTAIVLDQAGRSLGNQPVDFAASSGSLEVTNPTTDATGEAAAVLKVARDPAPRVIDITASAEGVSETVSVNVTGTTLALDGPTSIGTSQEVSYTITLQDSAAAGIADQALVVTSPDGVLALRDTDGEPVDNANDPIRTNASGEATVRATVADPAAEAGELQVQAYSGGEVQTLTARQTVGINASAFQFVTPQDELELPVDAPQTVTVSLRDSTRDVPIDNATVRFATTRGPRASLGVDLRKPLHPGGCGVRRRQRHPADASSRENQSRRR